MTRHKDTASDQVKAQAEQREKEMEPTPVVRPSFVSMRNPVETEGTTEVSRKKGDAPAEFQSSVDAEYRARYEAAEEQKEKDIKELKKQSDGKPKV